MTKVPRPAGQGPPRASNLPGYPMGVYLPQDPATGRPGR